MSGWGANGGGFTQATQSPLAGTPGTAFQKTYDEQYILPVTIKMIQNAETEQNAKVINGRKLNFVSMVCLVHDIDHKQTFSAYQVDDSTGMMEIRAWCNDGEQMFPNIQSGLYVKIMGKLQIYNDTAQVTAMQMKHITSTNDVTNHLIKCVYTHMKNKQHHETPSAGATAFASSLSTGEEVGGGVQAGTAALEETEDMAGWTQVQKVVFATIKQMQEKLPPSDNDGVHIPKVAEALSQHAANDIRGAVGFLIEGGMLYDTVSDEYVKTT